MTRNPDVPRQKRAHSRARTGCKTCRIRKVRCDEKKPACDRCTLTGRTCDGYPTSITGPTPGSISSNKPRSPENSTSSSLRLAPSADARLMLPRESPEELRSHRYFLEVVGPALSSFFDADFWLVDIPQVLHRDPAVWHAIICLSSVYELDACPTQTYIQQDKATTFALHQCNASIRLMTKSCSLSHANKGRALTLSIIFSFIAVIQGFQEQASMHLRAGASLLYDIIGCDLRPTTIRPLPSEKPTASKTIVGEFPVSIAPIRNILLKMDLLYNGLGFGALLDLSLHSRIAEDTIFWAWWFYLAPVQLQRHKTRPISTPRRIHDASRAAESLMNGMVYATSLQEEVLSSLPNITSTIGNNSKVDDLAHTQRTYLRGYRQLRKALAIFEQDLETNQSSRRQLCDAIVPLRLYLNACSMLLVGNPDGIKPDEMEAHSEKICKKIIADSDTIFRLGNTYLEVGGQLIPFTPNSSVIDALSLVAHLAPTLHLRRLASGMLRRTQMEGIWYAAVAGKLADVVMDREAELMADVLIEGSTNQGTQGALANGAVDDQVLIRDTQLVLLQVRKPEIIKMGKRNATVSLQTWGEWMAGVQGKIVSIKW